jgi:hypothetical protein
MKEPVLLRALCQPKPRYIIPRTAIARSRTMPQESAKHSAGAVLVVAFVFWLVYFLMRQFTP